MGDDNYGMAHKKKWLNGEMWQEVVTWKKGGLTYGEICGWLSKETERFRLRAIPSEDTIRREVTRRLAAEDAGQHDQKKASLDKRKQPSDGPRPYREFVDHNLDDLLKVIENLKHRLQLPHVDLTPTNAWLADPLPHDTGSNAKLPYLEKQLRRYTSGNPVWDEIDQFARDLRRLRGTAETIYKQVQDLLAEPGQCERLSHFKQPASMVEVLFPHAIHKALDMGGLETLPWKEEDADGLVWEGYGAFLVPVAPQDANSAKKAYDDLLAGVSGLATVHVLRKGFKALRKKILVLPAKLDQLLLV